MFWASKPFQLNCCSRSAYFNFWMAKNSLKRGNILKIFQCHFNMVCSQKFESFVQYWSQMKGKRFKTALRYLSRWNKAKFRPQIWLKKAQFLGIWLTLASPGHFFTFEVSNMELGYIRRDCDTAKVRRNEKSMHFLRFKFGVISRPNILLTGRKPTKHPKVPRKCQKHCQTPCLDGHHWYYVFYPLFKSFEYLFGLNYPQKPLKRSWLK